MNFKESEFNKNQLTQFLNAIPYVQYLDINVHKISLDCVILKTNLEKWRLDFDQRMYINYGFIYGIVDTVAYLAILNRLRAYRPAVTLSLKIDHFTSDFSVNDLYFKAECIEIKKQYAYSYITVYQLNKKVIANANATFLFKNT